MKAFFRIPMASAALAVALVAAVPAFAAPVPAAAAPGVVLPNGEKCSPMLARWQSAEADYSALNPADLDSYNVAQNDIDRAAHFCEAGQDAEAKAIMDASKRPPSRLQ